MEKPKRKTLLQIAIDGPVAAGKGDIASRLARRLGITYLYTGAMYRALAVACMRRGVSAKEPEKVVQILDMIHIDLYPKKNGQKSFVIRLDSEDITDIIHKPEISMLASDISAITSVRKKIVKYQKLMAKGKSVVMEGRDIGLRVLPQAQLKIYLTATLEERAKRRFKQFKSQGIKKTFAQVLEDTQRRDKQDMSRKIDPLRKLSEAWEIDTTMLTQEEVIAMIVKKLNLKKLL
ncbi:(d)CMP kinase [Candidatus Gottesmanbacteria bacterium]|nr:(d)CMP kinase [Candidatus Gottesmanbacteria bacterium]